MHTKRLFLAIPLSQYFLELFERYQKSSSLKNIRWIPAQNLHITVYFLGDVEEQKIKSLSDQLRTHLSTLSPFVLEFEKILFAPPHRPPRMVWATFAPHPEYQK